MFSSYRSMCRRRSKRGELMNGSYRRGEFVEDAAIKPCPKCGRPPTEYVHAGGDWMFTNGSRIFGCHECGISTELHPRNIAIEKWNEGAYKK